jgi:xylulokinase
MTLVAGIDSSTQSCKVLVCDAATGELVREGRASGTTPPRRWAWGPRRAT